MIFDRTLVPLYGWMFPESASRVNIGVVVDGARAGASGDLGNLRPVFEAFYSGISKADCAGDARWPLGRASYLAFHMGADAAAPGVLYVGESARLTNAATGEGIYQAMRCGVLAADTLTRVLSGRTSERRAWQDYTRTCRRTFTPGFVMGHAFRGAVRLGVLDAVARAYDRPRLRRIATWAIGSALTASSVWGMAVGSRNGADATSESRTANRESRTANRELPHRSGIHAGADSIQ